MTTEVHDMRGLRCPQPTLKLTVLTSSLPRGSAIEVIADCPSFEPDVRKWCERLHRTIIWMRDEGGYKRCQLQI